MNLICLIGSIVRISSFHIYQNKYKYLTYDVAMTPQALSTSIKPIYSKTYGKLEKVCIKMTTKVSDVR